MTPVNKFRMPRQGSVHTNRLPEIPKHGENSLTLTTELVTEFETVGDASSNNLNSGKKTTRFTKRHPTVWKRRRSHDLKQRMMQATFHEVYTGQLASPRDSHLRQPPSIKKLAATRYKKS